MRILRGCPAGADNTGTTPPADVVLTYERVMELERCFEVVMGGLRDILRAHAGPGLGDAVLSQASHSTAWLLIDCLGRKLREGEDALGPHQARDLVHEALREIAPTSVYGLGSLTLKNRD